tara:strand:+ start:1170 stop:1454 length:285 start_codon:yes stop_codon:yes gene_type:complete
MSDTEEPEERIDEPYIQWKAENQRNENDYISSRWSQLYSLEEEWGKEAVKYIILLNSGGAVPHWVLSERLVQQMCPLKRKWHSRFLSAVSCWAA